MTAPPALTLFIARAEARKILYDANEFDLEQALGPLLRYAEESGVLDSIGERGVYDLLNQIFKLEAELAL